jgi:lipid-binding SYLF domain-containing protein
MTRSPITRQLVQPGLLAALVLLLTAQPASAQTSASEVKLADAIAVLEHFTSSEEAAIPQELLARAHGIGIIPSLFRGGFILGGRRGKGVLVVRDENGQWSNPAFITLTGGSIGWQIGAESVDLMLIFANDRAVRNIESGKFTLGGDASAVAGPVGRHNTAAVTFRAEIYAYIDSRGLFAGAALEGARLGLDRKTNDAFYASTVEAVALGPQSSATPSAARRFLLRIEQATTGVIPPSETSGANEEAVIFPLEGED